MGAEEQGLVAFYGGPPAQTRPACTHRDFLSDPLPQDDRGMMTRAAAAMVKLEMQSDELARFLVATIGTSTHSPDAIAKSFELRDPVGPVPLRTENVRSHIEIAVGAGGAAAAHGSCHGERPEMQAR